MTDLKKQAEFTFHFRDINYIVKTEKKNEKDITEKTILKGISGYFKSGEITAIMGPSGSGKTSLLNFLTDRIQFPKNSIHEGEIFLNSEKIDSKKLNRISSYVMQDDIFFDVLTPKETLMFVAKLRYENSNENLDNLVENLLMKLKLSKCQDTQIGNDLRKGISGGEKKRLAIGIEILSNPSIFFLDEPTSGLDSATSYIIIDYLKDLAKEFNKIVVFTIHQPSSNIVELFDRLILVNRGEFVYNGLNENVSRYFQEIGHELVEKSNPADAFILKMEQLNSKNNQILQIEYQNRIASNILKEIEGFFSEEKKSDISEKNLNKAGFFKALPMLIKRSALNVVRNSMMLRLRIILVFIFSFFACSIFNFLKNDLIGAKNKLGFFFFFSTNNFMQQIFSTISTFPIERAVFLREYSNNLYGVTPYFVGKTLVETPVGLSITFFYSLIVYYIVGLRPGVEHYFIFVLIYVGAAFLGQGMGLLFGCAFSNFNVAMIVTQFSILPIFLFSGFLIDLDNIVVWLRWINYISPFRYFLEAAIRNEFDGVHIPDFPNPAENMDFDVGMWNCIIIIFSMGLAYRVLALIFLKILVRKVG